MKMVATKTEQRKQYISRKTKEKKTKEMKAEKTADTY